MYPIATELSYAVLEKRTRRGELATPALNQANQRTNATLIVPVVAAQFGSGPEVKHQAEITRHVS